MLHLKWKPSLWGTTFLTGVSVRILQLKNDKDLPSILFSGGHEPEWGKKDPLERQGPEHKKRNGHPVYVYCL